MTRKPLWSHALALQADLRCVRTAREFVAFRLTDHALPHLLDDVRLVVTELAANAVLHAQTPWSVSLSRTDGQVLLTVEDGSATPLVVVAPQLLAARGRGLVIVQALTDEWGVDTSIADRKSVWATFSVH